MSAPVNTDSDTQKANLKNFADSIQDILKEASLDLGNQEDIDYIKKLRRSSKIYEILGRSLLHFSLDPISWSCGVGALSLHYIQDWNIAHLVSHKTYDAMPEISEVHYARARSRSLHMTLSAGTRGHMSHHAHTAVVDMDADFSHHGWDRVTPKTPWKPHHLLQFPFAFLVFPGSMWFQSLHYAGFTDFLALEKNKNTKPKFIFIKNKSWTEFVKVCKTAAEGFVPYFAYNYVLFPALAGPFFWKVSLGNLSAETLTNVWMAAVNLGNHLGGDTEFFTKEEAPPKDRLQYILKTIRCCSDIRASDFMSFHMGGLNFHLAHHLAPKLPPNRLKRVTKQLKSLCKEYKVTYNEKSLFKAASHSLTKLLTLALPISGQPSSQHT